jgi:hypothetical protein
MVTAPILMTSLPLMRCSRANTLNFRVAIKLLGFNLYCCQGSIPTSLFGLIHSIVSCLYQLFWSDTILGVRGCTQGQTNLTVFTIFIKNNILNLIPD